MAKLVFYTKSFGSLQEVPKALYPILKRLTLGGDGVMLGYLPHEFDGRSYSWNFGVSYCEECGNNEDDCGKITASRLNVPRFVGIAYRYLTNKVIGWALEDNDGYLNVFVHNKYRRKGVARRLIQLGARHMDDIQFHTDEITTLGAFALFGSKYRAKFNSYYGDIHGIVQEARDYGEVKYSKKRNRHKKTEEVFW